MSMEALKAGAKAQSGQKVTLSRLQHLSSHGLKFAFGVTATLTAVGFLQEEVWAKKALLMLGGVVLITYILKAVKFRRAMRDEHRYREVIEARVCPAWYLEEVKATASAGGFADDMERRLAALGEQPSGIVVINALLLCKKKACHYR
jgi:hypothetical protein